MTAKKLDLIGFVVLIAAIVGFALRIIGTNPGFPQTHPDEPVIYSTVANMLIKNTLNPFEIPIYKFFYPGFVIYLNFFLFKLIFIPLSFVLNKFTNQPTSLSEVLGPGFINAMFWSRSITAFLSTLSIPLVFLIGKKIFDKKVGLIAAVFLTFNYRNVLSSHFGLLDSINGTFALLVMYSCLKILEKPSKKNYLFASLAVALSMATKLHYYSILAFAFVHIIVSLRKANLLKFLRNLFNINFSISIVLSLLIFILFNPFLLFNLSTAKHTLDYYNLRIGLLSPPLEITFPSIGYLYEIGFGKLMSILFILGSVLLLRKKKTRLGSSLFIFFIFLPCIFLLYLSHGGAYVRYFASITPFSVLISAYAFWESLNLLIKKTKFKKPMFLLAAIFLVFVVNWDQIKNTLILDYYSSKPWNSECIKTWMDKNIQTSDNVAISTLVPQSKNKKDNYTVFDNTPDHKNDFDLAELQNTNINFVATNIEYQRSNFNWWLASSGLYFGIPTEVMDNYFDSIAIKELSRHTVVSCVKPWQSPDNNFIVFEIPKKEATNPRLIHEIDFSQVKPVKVNFQSLYKSNQDRVDVIFSKDCLETSCLRLSGISGYPSRDKIHVANIIVDPSKRYLLTAMVKSTKETAASERDGFIRVDFYKKNDSMVRRGISAYVSQRYFGDGSWKQLTVDAISPKDADIMEISFQVERYDQSLFVSSVKLYEADNISSQDIKNSNKKEIDDEVLYPLSIL